MVSDYIEQFKILIKQNINNRNNRWQLINENNHSMTFFNSFMPKEEVYIFEMELMEHFLKELTFPFVIYRIINKRPDMEAISYNFEFISNEHRLISAVELGENTIHFQTGKLNKSSGYFDEIHIFELKDDEIFIINLKEKFENEILKLDKYRLLNITGELKKVET